MALQDWLYLVIDIVYHNEQLLFSIQLQWIFSKNIAHKQYGPTFICSLYKVFIYIVIQYKLSNNLVD